MDDTCANPSWTVLIVYKCVSRALWASCVYTFTALSESVFSEAFLVGMDDGVPTFMDFSGIARSVFLDLIAPDCHVLASLGRQILRVRPQGERSCDSFCCVNNGSTNRKRLKRAF